MNVLVIAPHPDDETLGCGGAVCKHIKDGDRVSAVFLTSGELGLKHLPARKARAVREREARKAARLLGLSRVFFLRRGDWMLGEQVAATARALGPVLQAARPELLYLPHPGDGHPDHQAALPILRRALRGSRLPAPRLLCYEVWTPLAGFDVVLDITGFMPRKLRALRAHASQLKEFNYLRAIRGLNEYRGVLAGHCRYAEVFSTPASP